jgi:hypothetical protein
MKNIRTYKIILASAAIALLMTACFKDTEILFEKTQVEFEDAVLRTPQAGEIFPLISLTRASGSPTYQMNLIGRQLTQGENITFSLDTVPKRLLNATTIEAQEGVHFTLTGAGVTFPENASTTNFGAFSVVSTFPAQAGKTALFIIKLDGNEKIAPAENYRRLGFRINLN